MNQAQHPSILNISRQNLHQLALVDGVEELFQVHIYRPYLASVQIFPAFLERIVSTSFRSEAVARLCEFRFVDWRQHLRNCLLDDTVYCGWDSQFSCLTIVLGDFYPSDGLRLVFPSQDGLSDFFAIVSEILQKFIHFHPIDSACPFVLLHPLVGAVQISTAHDFFQQSTCLSVGIGGVVLGYPLVNKRFCFLFVFRTIPPQTAIATAMFCAFFSLDFGNFHLLPPPRVPPFPTPSTALVLWIHLTSCDKSCFNHAS